MLHAREDYNRIQDPLNLIPEDEPVFLLRAQDVLAVKVLHYYRDLLLRSPIEHQNVQTEILRRIKQHIIRFENWPVKKFPDVPEHPQQFIDIKRIEAAILKGFFAHIYSYHSLDTFKDFTVCRSSLSFYYGIQQCGYRHAILVDNLLKFESMVLYSDLNTYYTRVSDKERARLGFHGVFDGYAVIDVGSLVTGIVLITIPTEDAWWDVNEVESYV